MTFEANGRAYGRPSRPTLAICADGTGPDYVEGALDRGVMPNLCDAIAGGGTLTRGTASMPTLTNVNNASIVTGVSAARHGIVGNHFLGPDGRERQLTDAKELRADSILSRAREEGVATLCVTAKDKLRSLLSAGAVPCVSAEKADELPLDALDGRTAAEALGRPGPHVYDPELSTYALDLALRLGDLLDARLVYCSLTDYVQHKAAPGEPLADRLLAGLDERLGAALAAGWLVGITADHGMSDKSLPDGRPDVRYLSDVLDRAGVRDAKVILPITDAYIAHHGALGSFAWIHVSDDQRARARAAVAAEAGVEAVLDRSPAARLLELPADRIGDLVVCADGRTVLGKSEALHDLSGLGGALRSHGGLHEQAVPIVVCAGIRGEAADCGQLRNADLLHLLLNAAC